MAFLYGPCGNKGLPLEFAHDHLTGPQLAALTSHMIEVNNKAIATSCRSLQQPQVPSPSMDLDGAIQILEASANTTTPTAIQALDKLIRFISWQRVLVSRLQVAQSMLSTQGRTAYEELRPTLDKLYAPQFCKKSVGGVAVPSNNRLRAAVAFAAEAIICHVRRCPLRVDPNLTTTTEIIGVLNSSTSSAARDAMGVLEQHFPGYVDTATEQAVRLLEARHIITRLTSQLFEVLAVPAPECLFSERVLVENGCVK